MYKAMGLHVTHIRRIPMHPAVALRWQQDKGYSKRRTELKDKIHSIIKCERFNKHVRTLYHIRVRDLAWLFTFI